MKNIRNIKVVVISLLTLIFIQGCDETEFLDRYSKSSPNPDNFFVDASSARMALNACYSEWLNGALRLNRDMIIILDAMTDDSYWRPNRNTSIQLEQWDVYPSHSNVEEYWRMCYRSINAANFALENIPKSSDPGFTEEMQKPYMGEGYFFRAYNYLFLTMFYGDIPLFVGIEEDVSQYNKPRTERSKIYEQIIEDFKLAAENLPDQSLVPGTPCKAAALGFLAKTYLIVGNNEKAEQAARDAVASIDAGGYGLMDDYMSIWSEEGNKELLFFWSYVDNSEDYGQNMTVQRLPRDIPGVLKSNIYGDGWGYSLPQKDLYDAFEDDDPRRAYTMYSQGDDFGVYEGSEVVEGVEYIEYNEAGEQVITKVDVKPGEMVKYSARWSPTGLNVRKMTKSVKDLGNVRWDGLDIPVMRVAEVYLLLAEALAEQGKAEALVWVNKVRSRPSVNMPEKTTADGDLVDIVRHERRVELAMEGLRIYDLIRWDILEETFGDGTKVKRSVFSDYLPDDSSLKYDSPVGNLGLDPVWPIPQDELDQNDQINVQNPGF
ncbi:MAG: RagB/SusD family nutrient uptake outer membrane protein [Prolixibacteraceae bacterium]|nr:RagB/SusD family nutrient uptake outer membrane protein [Prolixibacteraceae bacterium]